jgi:hypothetical protein
MKFKQVNDFPEGRVWTSPELLAGNGILQATNITGLYPGSYPTIHLKCSARSIFVKLDRLPPGRQLTLVGMVDDHDVELGRLPGGTSYDDQFETFPKVAPEVRSVRVSIAASELRSFEFLARPTRE